MKTLRRSRLTTKKLRKKRQTAFSIPILSLRGYSVTTQSLHKRKLQMRSNLKEAERLISQELNARYD